MTSSSRLQYRLQPASLDDTAGLEALLTRCRLAHLGYPSSRAEAKEHLTEPGTDPARDAVVARSAAGELIGFGRVWPAGSDVKCFVRVDPDATGCGIGTALLSRLEERAREIVGTAPSPMTLTHWAADVAAPPLLRSRGFTEKRYFLRMDVDPSKVDPVPVPAGLTIRPYRPGADDAPLYNAFVDAFSSASSYDGETADAWWHERRESEASGYDPTLWHVAVESDEIAGFCLCKERVDERGAAGYVSDIGVRRAWRQRGLGHALLAHALRTLSDRGLTAASLDVDADNTAGALALYRKVGMKATPLFTIWEKEVV
jgi:mycothiol synthase